VGLERACINPLCRLVAIESVGGLCVTPVVAMIDPPDVINSLKPSKDEVEAVFTVPLEFFLDKSGNLNDSYDIPWSGSTFTVRTYFYEDHQGRTFKIWGLTAHIIHQVARIALEEGASVVGTQVDEPSLLDTTILMSGELWKWEESKQTWLKRYFVITEKMLHQYSSASEADRKSSTATKKNRLPLDNVSVEILKQEEDGRFPFLLSNLGGRITCKLAAASNDMRENWKKGLHSQERG